MNTTTFKNELVNRFIIETTLIDPIKKIVAELNSDGFRDCDIKWLNDKLDGFMVLASKTLGIETQFIPVNAPTIMNQYAKAYYLRYFNQLLAYYKKLND
jgi:hypothetical protein